MLFRQRCVQFNENYLRFADQGGEESLHDFRVSLRRLRSLLRNYRDRIQLDDAIIEQLRQLQRETNSTRDLEVIVEHLEQLDEQAAPLLPSLQQQLEQAYRQLHTLMRPQWQRLWPALNQPLPLRPSPPEQTTFGALSGTVGRHQARRLAKDLHRLHDKWSDARLHRIRIRAKRLRYLLEPIATDKGEKRIILQLKRFQDELGDHRDLQHLLHFLESLPVDTDISLSGLIERCHKEMRRQEIKVKRYRKPVMQTALIQPLKSVLNHLAG